MVLRSNCFEAKKFSLRVIVIFLNEVNDAIQALV